MPLPPGKSGATAPTSMAMSVKKDTKFPKAALALAVFFTNPKSMLEFSKIVGIYPSTPESYEDEFFTRAPVAIEEQVRPIAKDIIASQQDLMPEFPTGVAAADVNQIVLKHVQEALFNNVAAQAALDAAVAEVNALIP